jgi:NADH-quinone oxidoreductase subunit G
MANTTKIFVDNRAFEVSNDQSMLEACLALGFDLPYFCWHPALGSVGACRQCAVIQYKDEKDTRGRLVMSCMTPVAEGIRISIKDPEAVDFRKAVIEGLMENHPHDCPVCDEGGECHLQDMTVMSGHAYRRYRFRKRTFRNQNLGPLVNHEMNRCIQCYRCVRYYREYAGGHDLKDFVLRDLVYFGRHNDGVLENEFSGNLVEICPTGVFTDKTLKQHYTRKWDLQLAPSVCAHCGVGCNTSPGERYGTLRRIVNRYNGEVNGYFLCDRGRFGYEFVNSAARIRQPLLKSNGTLQPATKLEALERVRALLEGGKAIGIGSPRASLESNFALRTLVGPERFFAGVTDEERQLTATMLQILRGGPARSPSLREIELSDAVLVLGEDVTQTAPRMALSLRQSVRQQPFEFVDKLKIPRWLDHAAREAVQQDKGPFFIAAAHATRLDDVATGTFRAAPQDVARLGFAVAHALGAQAPDVPGLLDERRALAGRIAGALKNAKRPLVVSGPSLRSEAVIQAAANVAWALCRTGKPATLSFTAPECNTLGLGLMEPKPLGEAVELVRKGEANTVIVLENDLYHRIRKEHADVLLASGARVVALDALKNPTAGNAEVVLPSATFAESEGTFVSNEGRAQRFFAVYVPAGEIQTGWQWLRDMMIASGRREATAWECVDDVLKTLGEMLPALSGARSAAPSATFRVAGEKIAREPHRYSGRTAMHANINVSEPKTPDDPESPLSFSMEGYSEQPPPALIPFFWSPGWNSIQSVNKFQQEIAGPLRGGDPGVRLIEPARNGPPDFLREPPTAFERKENEWLIVPLYHIFGSDELSHWAPAIMELTPKPYIALNADDAARLGLHETQEVDVTLDASAQKLAVKIRAGMPAGIAGLPMGLPGLPYWNLPAWGRIAK